MTEGVQTGPIPLATRELIRSRLASRQAAERRFRVYGLIAVALALFFLVLLFATIAGRGYSAFVQTEVRLEVMLDPAVLDPQGTGDPAVLARADYGWP